MEQPPEIKDSGDAQKAVLGPEFNKYHNIVEEQYKLYEQANEKIAEVRESVALLLVECANGKKLGDKDIEKVNAEESKAKEVQSKAYETMMEANRKKRLELVKLVSSKDRKVRDLLSEQLTTFQSSFAKKFEEGLFEESISADHIVIISENIGSGSFGKVCKAVVYGNNVAVKVLTKNTTEEAFKTECLFLKNLKSDYILKYMGACMQTTPLKEPFWTTLLGPGASPPAFALVSELMENGSLHSAIYTNNKQFTWPKIIKIANQITDGMQYLHDDAKVIHLDLKPQNILLNANHDIRIADFGFARLYSEDERIKTIGTMGTPFYMAPEILPLNEFSISDKISPACDVYSFGILLNELVCRKPPYPGVSDDLYEFAKSIITGTRGRPPLPTDDEGTYVNKIIELCWHQDPNERPKFSTIATLLKDVLTGGYVKSSEENIQQLFKTAGNGEVSFVKWVKAYQESLKVEIGKTAEDIGKNKYARIIKYLLNVEPAHTHVKEQSSNQFLNWMHDIDAVGKDVFHKLYDLVTEPWFWGFTTPEKLEECFKKAKSREFAVIFQQLKGWYLYYWKKDKDKRKIFVSLSVGSTFKELRVNVINIKKEENLKPPTVKKPEELLNLKMDDYIPSGCGYITTGEKEFHYKLID